MRSDLVFSAGRVIENRFLLVTAVIRTVRTRHIDSTRTEDTANQAFSHISQGRCAPMTLPEPAVPHVIGPLLIAPAA